MKFCFALLCVLCAYALARDENSKALKATATSTDAPLFDTVLLTKAKSALFGNCITKANTRKMQYSYISDTVQEISFVQHEVSRFAQGLSPLNWEREIQCKDIFDCSRASKDYIMFQYNGQTCRMFNQTYADMKGEFCAEFEDYTKDIVYVNNGVQPTGCPAHTDVVNGKSGPRCLGVIRTDFPFSPRTIFRTCSIHYMGPVYYDNDDGIGFDTIRNIMRNKKYQGDFWVAIAFFDGKYSWSSLDAVNMSYFAVQPQEPLFQRLPVVSSSHDYLLVARNDTENSKGFICLGYPFKEELTEP